MVDHLLTGENVDIAAGLLLRGRIIAFPTDTVYGLAAHPGFPAAIRRLFIAKQRPQEKAIPILLSDPSDLSRIAGDPSPAALLLAHECWPGALTIVARRREVHDGESETVALRVPALDLAREIIRAAGGALAVTSANISGGPNCTMASEVVEQLRGRIDAVVDGGACPGGIESTVVDTTGELVRVLRVGGLPLARLLELVQLQQ